MEGLGRAQHQRLDAGAVHQLRSALAVDKACHGFLHCPKRQRSIPGAYNQAADNSYLIDSSLATAAVKPASDTGMVTGLRVTDSMPMFRLVPDFMALMRSADSGVAA